MTGKGQFGDVLVGKACNIVANAAETLVMLKTQMSADESTQAEFYREMELFNRCHHDNIVALLGISRESFPVFAIYEYTDLVSHCSTSDVEDKSVVQCQNHCLTVARDVITAIAKVNVLKFDPL